MFKKLACISFIFISINFYCLAQNVTISSYVDRNTVSLNEILKLTVEIKSDEQIEAEPEIPQLTGFQIIGQSSSSSTSIEIINNQMSRSVTQSYTYSLRPLKVGQFTIPPIYTKFGKKTYRSKSINVAVVEAQDTFDSQNKDQQIPKSTTTDGVQIFLQAQPNKKEIYVGEPLTIRYTLYSNKGLVGLNAEKMPKFSGFVQEETFEAKNITHTIEVIEGMRYYAYRISDYTLFPTYASTFKLDSMELLCAYEVPAKSFFDFGTTKRVYIQSNQPSIRVQPLPLEEQPQDFSGAVGKFNIIANLSSSQVKTGESVTLTLTISGSGNIRMFDPPRIPTIPNIDSFTPEVSEELYPPYNINGKKIIKYILIPEEPGSYTFPSIPFTYFEPTTRSYKTIQTDPMYLHVEKGKDVAGNLAYIRPQDIDIQGRDIHFIISKDTIEDFSLIILQIWYWLIVIIGILSIVAAVIFKREREKLLQDRAYYRSKISNKQLQKDIQTVQSALKQKNSEQFCVSGENALKNYIANRCNISAGASKIQDIISELHKHNVEESLVARIQKFLLQTDTARFGGVQYSDEELSHLYHELNDIITILSRMKFRRKKK
ncbi:MAG TPA: protein BatD [Candidatus Cloacimonetes bacterium]|nr:protein BatD [Candidatus Cloacimonadota bacterium]HEX38281.1 protein BatD [Candidatus Cloacimonadota bacterium]